MARSLRQVAVLAVNREAGGRHKEISSSAINPDRAPLSTPYFPLLLALTTDARICVIL